jgi:hypothetical protein
MSTKRKIQKNFPYSRKGLLMEIFRKEAETRSIRKPVCYNDAAMKTKPIIRFVQNVQLFTADGDFITDEKAREIWDSGTGDWTQGAFQEMSRRVLS